MKEDTKTASKKERVSFNGKMARNTKDSGAKI